MENFLIERDFRLIGEALFRGYKVTQKSTISIFLCGGRMDNLEAARPRFFRAVKDSKDLRIRMPEGIFDDLLEKKAYDLLELEEILAHSVDAIVIFPESPGSFAELGAFSGSTALQRKIICVCEESYKNALSFINVGPIKILRKVKKSRVIYCKYGSLGDKARATELASIIAVQVRAIKKEAPKADTGLFLLEDLITYALFCMQSVSRNDIKKLYTGKDIGVDDEKLDKIYEICLNTLLTANRIEKNEHGMYELSHREVRAILERSNKDRLEMLHKVRVETMNSSLRRHAEVKSNRM
jgi:hypothetical protein